MASIRVRTIFSGLADVKEATRKASKRLSSAGRAGIYAAAQEIIRDAKNRAPVDTGALRESGYATMPDSGNRVEIGFGGHGNTSASGAYPEDYAIPQHEREDYNHRIGQAKYLIDAINAALAGRGLAAFARAAQREFNSGGGMPNKEVPSSPEEGD